MNVYALAECEVVAQQNVAGDVMRLRFGNV